MIIHLATDHAGFAHKEEIATWLLSEGYEVIDHGASQFNEDDDFTDFISLAVSAVSKEAANTRAVIFGGSGQGEAMLANRYPNVRAVVYYGGDESVPALSRQHNNSNVLSVGARFVSVDAAKKAIWDWLHTAALSEGKYERRNQKIEAITKQLRS